MTKDIGTQVLDYLRQNGPDIWLAVNEHISISLIALLIASMIGLPLGIFCAANKSIESHVVSLFQTLRIIPSLAILLLMLPVLGPGADTAIIALTILAVPPILMSTIIGIQEVPLFIRETASGLGMTRPRIFLQVILPLALPHVLNGIKIAAVEVVASATLASKIGAGGLGEVIFTGLGLNRPEMLITGGLAVALLAVCATLLFDLIERIFTRYKFTH